MERVKFQHKKKKILKIVAITLTSLLVLCGILALLYVRFGIAGLFKNSITSSVLGLNKQQDLAIPTISVEEKDEINDAIGYDPETVDRASLTSRKEVELNVSPQGAAYLLSSMLKNEETLDNLQISTTKEGALEISAIADIALICETVGESKETIESTIGELPDKVPLYSSIQPSHEDGNSSITSIKIGSLKVPDSLYTSINGYVDDGLEKFFSNALGIDLDNIGVENGNVIISGTFPAP